MDGGRKNPISNASEALEAFDQDFKEMASAVARGEYVFWLGSGLSREVVPDVRGLLTNLLDYLQVRVDTSADQCRFETALDEIFRLVRLAPEQRAQTETSLPLSDWPHLDDIVGRLIDNYSAVLDVPVTDEEPDFLVWDAIDVPGTYGDPTLVPGTEHLCVAILMLEGLVSSAATTNWDGLVEAAVAHLTADDAVAALRVIIRPEDFTLPGARSELIKFHGCAVKAAQDPDIYRQLLIARKIQVSGWAVKGENQTMKTRLEHLLTSKPALVVGLSAQDADIHTMLHQASANLSRKWPASPPQNVFAVQSLDGHHRHMLEITYGDDYRQNRTEIEESALLGGYAEPTLLGLVLYCLADKLESLLLQTGRARDCDAETMTGHIRYLRDLVGSASLQNPSDFVHDLVAGVRLILSVFRTGNPADSNGAVYEPLTVKPISDATSDPNFPADALGRLALVSSLLGRGHAANLWGLEIGRVTNLRTGSFTINSTSHGLKKTYIVRNSQSLAALEANGHIDVSDASVLVIHSDPIPEYLVRSRRKPKGRSDKRYGRDGKQALREISIDALESSSTDADQLFKLFQQEAGI